jgi:hypothetical protein
MSGHHFQRYRMTDLIEWPTPDIIKRAEHRSLPAPAWLTPCPCDGSPEAVTARLLAAWASYQTADHRPPPAWHPCDELEQVCVPHLLMSCAVGLPSFNLEDLNRMAHAAYQATLQIRNNLAFRYPSLRGMQHDIEIWHRVGWLLRELIDQHSTLSSSTKRLDALKSEFWS